MLHQGIGAGGTARGNDKLPHAQRGGKHFDVRHALQHRGLGRRTAGTSTEQRLPPPPVRFLGLAQLGRRLGEETGRAATEPGVVGGGRPHVIERPSGVERLAEREQHVAGGQAELERQPRFVRAGTQLLGLHQAGDGAEVVARPHRLEGAQHRVERQGTERRVEPQEVPHPAQIRVPPVVERIDRSVDQLVAVRAPRRSGPGRRTCCSTRAIGTRRRAIGTQGGRRCVPLRDRLERSGLLRSEQRDVSG